MKQIWQHRSPEEIKKRIFSALQVNVDYAEESILGVPGSYLDEKVFSQERL